MNFIKVAHAATKDWDTTRCTSGGVATLQGFECLFYNVLQVITFFAGLVFFFMFISGAFKYLFAGGDQKKLAAANAAITMSFFSLIGVIVSVLILRLLQSFTGIPLTKFVIPGGSGTP
jgi:hypothetical protein